MYAGEKLNSISHVVGAALALVGLGSLLTVAIPTGDPWLIVGFSVFGAAMVVLYTMSALYHAFRPPQVKRVFQLLDHVAIYLLIAGTYTPYMLVSLRATTGLWIFSAIWLMAAIGIVAEVLLHSAAAKVGQLIAYLGMGWACVFDMNGLKEALPAAGLHWLLAGGLAYTAGVIFYVLGKLGRLPHAHGVWHLFVLAGTLCHFVSILGYVR